MGPRVRFHWARVSTVKPSTKQPPGQRTNAGFRSAIIRARSGRRPFGRFIKVFEGNSETKSSQTVPTDPRVKTNCAFGSEPRALSLHSYFCHDFPETDLKTLLASILPSLLSRDAVTGPRYV